MKTLKAIQLIFLITFINIGYIFSQQITFTENTLSGCAPLNVNFTNTSTGNNLYYWDFGDGQNDTGYNVSHTYQLTGQFIIALNAFSATTYQFVGKATKTIIVGGVNNFIFYPNDTLCPGEFFATGFSGQFDSLLWNYGDGEYSSHQWDSHVFSDAGNYDITLIAHTNCGTDTVTQTLTITGAAIPSYPDIHTSGGSQYCIGDEILFQTSIDYDYYLWDFDDGNISNDASPSYEYSSMGFRNVSLTVKNICGNSNSSYMYIDINGNVPADANFNIMQTPVCPGDPVGFSSHGGKEFQWDFGDGGTSSSSENKYVYGDTGTYTVTLIVTNGCGNTDTSQGTVLINYNTANKPSLYAIFKNNNWNKDTVKICTGEEVSFQSWSGGQGNIELYWDFGDGTYSNVKDPTHAFNNPGLNHVTLVALNNCNGSDTIRKWVLADSSAMPVTNLMIIPQLICPGEKVYFFNDGNEMLETGYSFSLWFGDGDSLIDITEYTDSLLEIIYHYYNDTGSFNYTFTATNGCGNTNTSEGTILVENDILNETFYYVENSTEGGNEGDQDKSGCPGDPVKFLIVGGSEYEWHFGDGNISTDQFAVHYYADTGAYSAFVIATNACGKIDTLYTEVSIGTSNTPKPWFYLESESVCAGDSIHFLYSNQGVESDFYSFEWNFDDGYTSELISPYHSYLTGGEYNIKLVITNGCGSDSSFRLVRVANPLTDFSISQYTVQENVSVTFTNLTQNASSYLWDFGDGTTSTSVNPSHTYTAHGIYAITLTSTGSTGCSSSYSDTIYVHNILIASELHNNSCWNGNDGYIDITVTGGNPPYQYQWFFNNSLTNIISQDFYNSDFPNAGNFSSGTIQVIVTDLYEISVFQTYTFQNPAQLFASLTVNNELCGNDGNITADISGGTAPYSYQWSNWKTDTVITDLIPDTYSLTVTDFNGCKIIQTAEITANPEKIQQIYLFYSPSTCNNSDGMAWVGGIVPLQTDSLIFIWNDSFNQINDTAYNLSAGVYRVTVTNTSNGCSEKAQVALSDINNTVMQNYISSEPTCHGGNDGYISVNLISPNSPLSVEWGTNPIQYDGVAQNLTAGSYSMTVTDQLGCNMTSYFNLSEPEILEINMSHSDPLCFGSFNGNAMANVTGGRTPYTYHWNNGSPYPYLQNRNANTYYLTVTDAGNCTAVSSVTLSNPPQLALSAFIQDVNFYGESNGSIGLTVSGGNPPFLYNWSNGKQTQDIEQLSAGTYSVTVTDQNNCINTSSYNVVQPALLSVDIIPMGQTQFCYGDSVVLDAGSGYLGYEWSTGETTQSITVYESGYYYVACLDSTSYGIDSIYINAVHPYSAQELCLVSVDSTTNKNVLIWEKPYSETGIVAFNLYKETTSAGIYQLMTSIPYDDLSMFTDTGSNPAQHSDRYRISVIDTCGNESEMSSPHKTMHLTVSTGIGVYNLIWENYEGFSFPSYTIFRGITPGIMLPIGAIQSSLTSYTDYQPIGTFYYRIIVMKNDSCWASSTAKEMSGPFSQSLSNIEDNGIIEPVNVQQIKPENLISVFPNPFRESTMVYFNNNAHLNFVLNITDVTGKIVRQIKNITGNYIEISKGDMNSGFYMIELKCDKTTYHKTIIVE